MNTELHYPTITEQKFNELIATKKGDPFMVVFTADWLGEGTIMDAIVEQLSEEYENQFGFYRIDIEQSKEISHQLGIRRLPTIYFFQVGEMVGQFVGIKAKRILKEQIDNML